MPVWNEPTALGRRFGFGRRRVHDANIVATMLAHGAARLLTLNEADFRRLDVLIEGTTP